MIQLVANIANTKSVTSSSEGIFDIQFLLIFSRKVFVDFKSIANQFKSKFYGQGQHDKTTKDS